MGYGGVATVALLGSLVGVSSSVYCPSKFIAVSRRARRSVPSGVYCLVLMKCVPGAASGM